MKRQALNDRNSEFLPRSSAFSLGADEDGSKRDQTLSESFLEGPLAYLEYDQYLSSYRTVARILKERFGAQKFSLLELGCGSGKLCEFLPASCSYTGVDSSLFGIRRAEKQFPQHNFHRSDLSAFLSVVLNEPETYDVIVLSRFFAGSHEHGCQSFKEPLPIVASCAEHLLRPSGLLIFQDCFAYGDENGNSLFVRGGAMLSLIEQLSAATLLHRVSSELVVHRGLEQIVATQKSQPAWFAGDTDDDGRYRGQYLASWIVVKERVGGRC